MELQSEGKRQQVRWTNARKRKSKRVKMKVKLKETSIS
jgi:hypothetical protein